MHVVKRNVKGRTYYFLEKSVRLPDGHVRKLSRFFGAKKPVIPPDEMKQYFLEKEKELAGTWAVQHYTFDYPLTEQIIKQIEHRRIEYKYLMHEIPERNKKDILDRLTVNFTYESNAIEGNSLTLKDVAIVIFEKENISGKSLQEIYETRNHRKITELLFAKKIKISHESIIHVHKLLMKDIEKEQGYKTMPNFILGSHLQTSPPEKVHEHLTELIEWYNKNADTVHPLQCAAHFHSRFLQIHPFSDGNGRVARVLLNAMLIRKDYPPLIIRKTNRTRYLNALHAYDQKSPIKLVRFLIEKYKNTFEKFFHIYMQYLRF